MDLVLTFDRVLWGDGPWHEIFRLVPLSGYIFGNTTFLLRFKAPIDQVIGWFPHEHHLYFGHLHLDLIQPLVDSAQIVLLVPWSLRANFLIRSLIRHHSHLSRSWGNSRLFSIRIRIHFYDSQQFINIFIFTILKKNINDAKSQSFLIQTCSIRLSWRTTETIFI